MSQSQVCEKDTDVDFGSAEEGKLGIDDPDALAGVEEAPGKGVPVEEGGAVSQVDLLAEAANDTAQGFPLLNGSGARGQTGGYGVEIQAVVSLKRDREEMFEIEGAHVPVGEGLAFRIGEWEPVQMG